MPGSAKMAVPLFAEAVLVIGAMLLYFIDHLVQKILQTFAAGRMS